MPERTDEGDLKSLVIEESDEARDMLDLAEQLEGLLPIESFDELVERLKGKQLRFRDVDFDVISLSGLLPAIVFPVTDARGLVSRVGEIVRSVPSSLGVDFESDRGQRLVRRARNSFAPGGGNTNFSAAAHTTVTGPAGDIPVSDTPATGERKA